MVKKFTFKWHLGAISLIIDSMNKKKSGHEFSTIKKKMKNLQVLHKKQHIFTTISFKKIVTNYEKPNIWWDEKIIDQIFKRNN